MRLPSRLQKFAGLNSADPPAESPRDVHFFSMQVPECGYQWIESATPAEFPPTRRDLLGEAPYMVFGGAFSEESVPARTYYPFTQPGLFLKFTELDLSRESILAFANQYGWIGATGEIDTEQHASIQAVGITVWQREIQVMAFACRLWDAMGKKRYTWLRQFLKWAPNDFNVYFSYLLQGKEILPARRLRHPIPKWAQAPEGHTPLYQPEEPPHQNSPRRPDSQGYRGWLIPPHEIPAFQNYAGSETKSFHPPIWRFVTSSIPACPSFARRSCTSTRTRNWSGI